MISNISFTGKVHYLGNTKNYAKNHLSEINAIQNYADENNLDIVVLNKDEYLDNSGFYTTLATRTDSKPGRHNELKQINFDFGCKRRDVSVREPIYII